MSAGPALRVEGLRKSFGGLLATRDVSFDVEAGTIHAIIGPNGAGKTTLIAQICGDLAPDAGRIVLDGVDVTRRSAFARVRAGLRRSFQITQLATSLSVRDNATLALVGLEARPFGFLPFSHASFSLAPVARDAALAARVDALLDEAGLQSRADRLVSALSHGDRKQLELALALAGEPRVVLLDEPLAGLGSTESDAMIQRLAAGRRRHAVVLVEHDMPAVFSLADRVTVLAEGAVLATGSPDAIRADERVRRVYLGD